MMKTALSIVQSVRKRLNLPAITALVGATDPDELQMIELLYAVCEEIRQAKCWTQLKRKYSFTTSASRTQYPLPADFYSPLAETHWNTSEDLRLVGPESDNAFGEKLYGAEPSSLNFTYRVFGGDEDTGTTGGQIEVSPTPGSAIACSFEYLTRSFLIPKFWVAGTAYALNSYCYANGNIYKCTDAITAADTQPTGQAAIEVVDDDGKWLYQGGAYETVIADTDLVVFDDDLVKLGLRAKWLEESGGEYAEAKAEFEGKIDKAIARYRGPYIGSLCGRTASRRYSVSPLRTWSI